MQLLVDTTQETPASLRFIAATLCALADTYGPPIESLLEPQPSINGPALPVVLHAPAPTLPPLGHQLDPAAVFARPDVYKDVVHEHVPAGTLEGFSSPSGMNIVPPAPANFTAFAPPAPTTIPPSALPAMTTAVGTAVPDAVVSSPVLADVPAAPILNNERDRAGLPWDARVHSETRKQNADGTWRFRRNLDEGVKTRVIAELKAQGSLFPTPPAAPSAPTTEQISIALGVAPTPPSVRLPESGPGLQQATAPLPVSAGVPMGLPNTPQSPVVPITGFRDFMSKVNKAVAAGKLTQEQVANACKAVGLDSITALAGDPMKIPLVDAQINQLLGAVAA